MHICMVSQSIDLIPAPTERLRGSARLPRAHACVAVRAPALSGPSCSFDRSPHLLSPTPPAPATIPSPVPRIDQRSAYNSLTKKRLSLLAAEFELRLRGCRPAHEDRR